MTTYQEARKLTDAVLASLDEAHRLLAAIFKDGSWKPLGYLTWGEYFSAEIGEAVTKIKDVDKRRAAVEELTQAGMSQRQVAAVIGVDQKTISNDLRAEEFSSPEPSTDTLLEQQGHGSQEDRALSVLTGKLASIMAPFGKALDKLTTLAVGSPPEAIDTMISLLEDEADKIQDALETLHEQKRQAV